MGATQETQIAAEKVSWQAMARRRASRGANTVAEDELKKPGVGIGGIVGSGPGVRIEDCHFSGVVIGRDAVGGVIGYGPNDQVVRTTVDAIVASSEDEVFEKFRERIAHDIEDPRQRKLLLSQAQELQVSRHDRSRYVKKLNAFIACAAANKTAFEPFITFLRKFAE